MPFLPVDTALVIPVGPCYDDTDFTSFVSSIAYNAAGMTVDLFTCSSAVVTKTDLALTSGGDNDWVFKGNGVHALEVTAAQNATKGMLWVVGKCDDVLAFESAVYTVVSVDRYAELLGTNPLVVNVTQIGGAAQRATDLAEIAQFLFANAATLSSILDDDSVIGRMLAVSAASGYNRTTDSLEAIANKVASGVGAGNGSITETWTFNDDSGDPLDDVDVWVVDAGDDMVARLKTNESGVVVFLLDAGTYTVYSQKDNQSPVVAQSIDVA